MMKMCNTTQSASAAIAVVLMLSPAAGLAQADPAPVITAPEIGMPPPAQPVSAPAPAPVVQAPVMTSSPVVQPVPVPDPAADQAPKPTASAPARTTTTRQAAPRPAAAASVAPPAAPAPEPAAAPAASEPAAVGAAPVAPAPVDRAQAAPEPARATTNDAWLPALLGGLAVLAAAIWGFVAIGRRKPVDRRAKALERPLPRRAEPVAATALAEPVVPEPAIAAPAYERVTPIGPARPTRAASLSHTGAAVALPRQMPETFAERDALLRRMVAAKPDRANPFTDYRARHKRAKLILQSLGRDFGDTEPWIDLSQYPQNWPELAARKHAAA